AIIDGRKYYLGRPAWVCEHLPQANRCNDAIFVDLNEHGDDSVVGLGSKDAYLASFFIADQLRPQTQHAIALLKALSAKVVVLSGDRHSVVRKVTAQLPVDRVEGDLSPRQKMQRVQELQAQGEVVAMLGDGINDAPVIAQADVSIAMSNGSEVSHSQADIILLNGQLTSLKILFDVASVTRRITRQNLTWALLYNAAVLPLAAAGLLTPWLAALGMSISSLVVVLNALRIGRSLA
ncbi:MAG: HAD-IC family P-type ATPase, partial [Gammaproteobacteria bacterium]|nr:HAD-IC family P-type ATPase [Gammaproteobacteria bacterium]